VGTEEFRPPVVADGGIFAYGDAGFFGTIPSQ